MMPDKPFRTMTPIAALHEAKNIKIDPAEIERLESVVRFSVAQLGIRRRRR